MHVVHRVAAAAAPGCGAGGCLAVVGVLFELAGEGEATESTAELEKIFGRLPSIAHEDVRCGGGGESPWHFASVRSAPPSRDALVNLNAWPPSPPHTQSESSLSSPTLDLNKLLPG